MLHSPTCPFSRRSREGTVQVCGSLEVPPGQHGEDSEAAWRHSCLFWAPCPLPSLCPKVTSKGPEAPVPSARPSCHICGLVAGRG